MLEFTISGHTKEDAIAGSKALAAMVDYLSPEIKWDTLQSMQNFVADATTGEVIPLNASLEIHKAAKPELVTITPTEARDAEQALLKETVAGTGKRRGRPGKTDPVVTPKPEDTTKDDNDLLDMLNASPAEITAEVMAEVMEVVEEVEAVEEEAEDDSIMALLGVTADEYDGMDHDALYNQVRDRMTGRSPTKTKIIGTWLGECIREAKQRDKKADVVSNFSDTMLRQLLRGADLKTPPIDVFTAG